MQKYATINYTGVYVETQEKQPSIIDRNFGGGYVLGREMVNTSFRIGSMDNPEDIKEAVGIVKDGGVVIAQFRSVYGVWVRADSAQAVEAALVKIKKGEVKPMVSMMTSRSFVEMIDPKRVHPRLRELVRDPRDFEKRLGAIAIVGAPIKDEFVGQIPNSLLSVNNGVHKMLNLDPTGNTYMTSFIESLVDTGILYVGVSSLNAHNKKEIASLEEAIAFVETNPHSRLLLKDPVGASNGVRGSFSIIDLENASAVRDGHIPIWFIENAIGVRLDKSNMEKPNYPRHNDFDKFKADPHHHYHPYAWRNLAIDLTSA